MAVAAIGAATVWNFIYETRPAGQPQIGLLNAFVGLFGVDPDRLARAEPAPLQQPAARWSSCCGARSGYSMVLLSAAVKGVPTDTLEAARIDGANEKQIFFQVVVPQIKGTIITVYVTVLIGS